MLLKSPTLEKVGGRVQCENEGIFLTPFFDKNYVKPTFQVAWQQFMPPDVYQNTIAFQVATEALIKI